MSGRNETDLARGGGVARTLPTVKADISVTTGSVYQSTALAAVRGRWAWLRARGGNITLIRGNTAVVANQGVTLRDGEMLEVYVPNVGEVGLTVIGSVACTLEVMHDGEG